MYVEQIYTNCLAEASYYIESNGVAAIIDPIREPEPYMELAQKRGATIKYVFETHFHADFVSGHIDLSKRTGATIVYGPKAETAYEKYEAKDGEIFEIGKVTIEILHTPGHTPESTSFLLRDENGADYAVFTGDTLFVGDVGRPDLLGGKMTKEELASMLYDSLNNKLKPLHDEVIVYPGHGPGSSCGKNLGKETFSTIGHQKRTNYAMQDMSREDFILQVTDGLGAPPAYFFMDARINKMGYEDVNDVINRNTAALSADEFEAKMKAGAWILDTRSADDFEKGFVPGSVNIGLNGSFALWVGAVVPTDKELILVVEEGKEHESVLRLARVGYENVGGILKGGVHSWKNSGRSLDTVTTIDARTFEKAHASTDIAILDVRKKGEFGAGHIKGAQHICLSALGSEMNTVKKDETVYVHCQGGYRSMVAVSLMQKEGFKNLVNIAGGYGAIKETSMPIEVEENATCS